MPSELAVETTDGKSDKIFQVNKKKYFENISKNIKDTPGTSVVCIPQKKIFL
jgi:hypothetical protein